MSRITLASTASVVGAIIAGVLVFLAIDALRPSVDSNDEDAGFVTYQDEELEFDEDFQLFNHHTYLATSLDGYEWTLKEEPIVLHSSVPSIVTIKNEMGPFPAGSLLTYFAHGDFENTGEDLRLGLIYSDDNGQSWSDRGFAIIHGGIDGTQVVDPSVIQLEDGRLRLFYFDFQDNWKPGNIARFYTAVSENGIDFEVEAEIFSSDRKITDPEVVNYKGSWYLFYADQESKTIHVAYGDSPLSFSDELDLEFPGIPGAYIINDEINLFGCGKNGMLQWTSTDGVVFEEVNDNAMRSSVDGILCDPSVTQAADGLYQMVVKQVAKEHLNKGG